MKMTLTFAEHDLRDEPGRAAAVETIERLGLDVITNGGTVEPTMCHDGEVRKRLTTAEDLRDWVTDFRRFHGM